VHFLDVLFHIIFESKLGCLSGLMSVCVYLPGQLETSTFEVYRCRKVIFSARRVSAASVVCKQKKNPWLESASELYRPSDRRLSKLVPTFADRGCRVMSVADPLRPYSRFSRPEVSFSDTLTILKE
jgi:hypothetical protein